MKMKCPEFSVVPKMRKLLRFVLSTRILKAVAGCFIKDSQWAQFFIRAHMWKFRRNTEENTDKIKVCDFVVFCDLVHVQSFIDPQSFSSACI